ncbi:MAG TPA: substrate-binding domain-containing protein [Atribacteraceae bacterium]|nr:substrate-binding domain-containing protein [Atribacteraceae bacterium]
MHKKTKISFLLVVVLVLVFVCAGSAFAKYSFTFLTHGGEGNVFWASVYRGAREAAARYGIDFVMIRPTEEGDFASQLASFEATLALRPDGIITSIPHPDMFDDVIQRAIDMGILVICSNTDDPEGAAGNARLSYIGQDLVVAGRILAQALLADIPEGETYHFLISNGGPGQVWAEQRAKGIVGYLEEKGHSYEILDTTILMDVAQSRIQAYLHANPETRGVLTVEYNHAAAARAAEALGFEPGELLIGGFDLVPEVLTGIQAGYIQLTVDQQPYLQGYLAVVQLYLMLEYGLSAWDVNTGNALVDATNVDMVIELARERIR